MHCGRSVSSLSRSKGHQLHEARRTATIPETGYAKYRMMTREALDAMYHNRCISFHLCRDQEDAKYQDDDDPSSSSTGVYHYAGVLGSVKFHYETYN